MEASCNPQWRRIYATSNLTRAERIECLLCDVGLPVVRRTLRLSTHKPCYYEVCVPNINEEEAENILQQYGY